MVYMSISKQRNDSVGRDVCSHHNYEARVISVKYLSSNLFETVQVLINCHII